VARTDEDVTAVIAAFQQAESCHGAARLLNDRGVPTRRGGPWRATSLRGILARNAPDLLPEHPTPGRKSSVASRFAGLLRCACGSTLTARHFPSGRFTYECRRSYDDPEHRRPVTVAESRIRPWAIAEADRLQLPSRLVVADHSDEVRRNELEGRRRRVIDNYEDGLIDKAERDSKLLLIATEMERSAATARITTLPNIDWTWPPAELNKALRALWTCIQLDDQMRPVQAEWTVPEWRAA
jgi:hypothetical protein